LANLTITTYEMPAARLGPENPLPPLVPPRPPSEGMRFNPNVPEGDRKYVGYGAEAGCLPHRLQDDYDRIRRPRAFRVAVLENETLRATFLLELGGRLWSLLHKPSNRELLYVNPVFQPANLAVRNAWFSGGVEWNIGVIGHTPYTCSPLFAARLRADDGTPVLRLYEWDRIRGTPYQIDTWLPAGSPVLFVRVRIINPHDREVPMYWWSNMAVAERRDVRVVVPTDRAYNFSYQGEMRQVPIPICDGRDATYPTNALSSSDWFYRVPDRHRLWIAALGKDGRGLVQASTSRLVGRKLFVWGMGPGGRRWSEFLAVPNRPYIEIQAGLGRTQAECLPMPAHTEWSWLEAYGLMEAEPKAVHGSDWDAARRAVQSRLDEKLPQSQLEAELVRSEAMANRAPEEIIQQGSGWGALERRRRQRAGERPFCTEAMVFGDASLGPDQIPWVGLLEKGALPSCDPADPPGAWMIQPEWRRMLEAAVREERGDHWLAWLHLGVMRYDAGEIPEAKKSWDRSIALAPSAWAYRNLAVLATHQGRKADAADLWLTAHRMLPGLTPLAIECAQGMIDAGRAKDLVALMETLPPVVRSNDRIRVLEARAALEVGDLDKLERILLSKMELANIREGEVVLSDLWFEMHEKRLAAREGVPIDDKLHQRARREFPPPAWIDFRMSTPTAAPPTSPQE
jgi:tetratricopeptide (TPR) repeat protein